MIPRLPVRLALAAALLPCVARAADSSPSGSLPAETKAPAAPSRYVAHAPTGHVTNYDEAKVGTYTLPDLLRTDDGRRVTRADDWFSVRRPELLRHYQNDVFGRVPDRVPGARVEVVAKGAVEDGAAVRKHLVVHFGANDAGPKADVVLYVPAKRARPAPVLLQLVFFRGLPSETAEPATPPAGRGPRSPEYGPVADILGRGYAYATFRYTDVQPDKASTSTDGVQALAYAAGQERPAPDEWGTIAVWAWAASRVLDALASDPDLDAHRVALIGHSRLGKTVLWASAMDPRFALVFSSCSGEMGAALSRRDFGETIDDMVRSLGWQFAGNFRRFSGHWQDLPVDAHALIALSAPRPVFVTAGTEDEWADPKGEFLALVAAGPVYRLCGKQDLGATTLPPLDQPLTSGSLGWLYHTGGHAILPGDWQAFLAFADRHLQ